MTFNRVTLESVDLEDQHFRISEQLESARLLESVRQVGQLSPVCLLARKESGLAVICGFRRVWALKSLGHPDVMAQIWHDHEHTDLEMFRLALWENLSHRELSPLEKARVLAFLKNHCGVQHDQLVEVYLPVLGLAPHKNTLRAYLALHGLDPQLREMLTDGRITLASAERLARAPLSFQSKMSSVLERVRWSASLQRETLDLLEELAAIAESDPDEILSAREITETVHDPSLSPFQKGERIHKLLYRKRNPRFSRTEEQFRAREQELSLPANIRVSPTPFFESSEIRVEFSVRSPVDFRDTAKALERAAQAPALEALFSIADSPIADCGLQIADWKSPAEEKERSDSKS
jgi:ParB-like chromosome segregation protein Spo0J